MGRFLLILVPSLFWDDRPRPTPPAPDDLLREQLREAKAIRERIETGVNLESERTRLTTVLGRIESDLLARIGEPRTVWDKRALQDELAMGRLPALELGDGYLHLMAAVEFGRASSQTPGVVVPADPLALGESIYRETQIGHHLQTQARELASLTLSQEAQDAAASRMAFYELAYSLRKHGIVEVQIVQDNRHVVARPRCKPAGRKSGCEPQPLGPAQEPVQHGPRRAQMVDRLHRDVDAAVRQFRIDGRGGKVNANNQPHEVSTDVFGEWLTLAGPSAYVRIVYADGSEGAPFPLCLGARPRPTDTPRTIRVALMSMRHLEIDRVVELAWYRNREVSQARSLAESDEFCFRYSVGELEKLANLAIEIGKPIRLEVYHTGFEPASIGLYRAVATMFAERALPAGSATADYETMRESWLIVAPQ